jgi:hypothetical protein
VKLANEDELWCNLVNKRKEISFMAEMKVAVVWIWMILRVLVKNDCQMY